MPKPVRESEDLWETLRANLSETIPADTFRVWFEKVRLGRFDEDSLELVAPNEFSAIWLRDNYIDIIRREAETLTGGKVSVNLFGEPELNSVDEKSKESSSRVRSTSGRPKNRLNRKDEIFQDLRINPKNTFKNFVVGAGSELAHAACIAVANAPAHAYNPLFLYGETGLGKTHLMHAVAHQALERDPDVRIVYVSCEKFTNEFIRAIQENTLTKFRARYRNVDFLLIDDVQFLAGKERIQEEFFHTLRAIVLREKLTSSRVVCFRASNGDW